MTRAQLRHAIATMVEGRGFALGTVTAMNGNAVQSADLALYPSEYFNDGELYVTSGTAIGQGRRIASFAPEGASPPTYGEASFFVPFSPNAAADDPFEIHPLIGWTVAQYNQAIQGAHDEARDVVLLDKVDTSLTMASGQYEYAVPAGFRYLADAQEDLTNGGDNPCYRSYPPSEWSLVADGSGGKALRLERITAGRPLRLVGQRQATAPAADDEAIEIPTHYAVARATALVLMMQPGGPIADEAARLKWAQYHEQRALLALRAIRTPVLPGSRPVEAP
jgi:hypothetical protein